MANDEHVRVVRQGAEAIAEWRWRNPTGGLDLSGARLAEAMLPQADLVLGDLSRADLHEANLAGALLSFANLDRAYLLGANLSGADLRGAWLGEVNFAFADLEGANLSEAFLHGTRFEASVVSQADFSNAKLSYASFAGVDLSQARGLGRADHRAPSSVGVESLLASVRGAGNQLTPDLRTFFRSAGVPAELLEALPRIVAAVQYYSCFVAYGEPDVAFARELCEHLTGKGVSCWLYEMHATPGQRTWTEIVRRRREADKVVVVCSADALVRDGVLKEIEEQVDEDPDKIVPISLDDLWKAPGFRVMRAERDLKPYLLERNHADFANLDYEDALERLLKGLRRETEQKDE